MLDIAPKVNWVKFGTPRVNFEVAPSFRSIAQFLHGLRMFNGRFAPQNAVRGVPWNGKLSDLTEIVFLRVLKGTTPNFCCKSLFAITFWWFKAKKEVIFHLLFFKLYRWVPKLKLSGGTSNLAQIGPNFGKVTLEAMPKRGQSGKMIRQLDRNRVHSSGHSF